MGFILKSAIVGLLIPIAAVQVQGAPIPTTTTLTVAPGPTVVLGTVVTLTASVRDPGAVTKGTVLFCNAALLSCDPNNGRYGTAQLTSSGTASLLTRFASGLNNIKAVFVPTRSHAGSTSTMVESTVSAAPIYESYSTLTSSGGRDNYSLFGTVTAVGSQPLAGSVRLFDKSDGNAELGTASLGQPSWTLAPVMNTSPVFTTSGLPMSVAVGDFNGDGMLDIATVNDDDRGFVAILLGNGDGTFQAPITYPVGTDPVFVAVGDFNGDGNLDLAVANSNSNNISVHLGNGDGTFQNPIFIPTGAAPGSIAIGDFNRDGQLDLAVANANSNNISILLGNGDGTFQAQVTHSSGLDPISIQVGDLNGDGNPDLVVANSWSNNLTVLLGNGDGTFGASQFYATDAGPLSVAIGDFNHDGIADLVTANFYGGDVSVLLGYGDGTFRTEMPYATAPQTASVSVADLNGDGSLDIVAGSTAGGELSIVLGAGDGTFHGAIQYAENSGPDSLDSIAVGDFDGDGQIDIASAFGPSVRVFLSEQVATFGLNEISVPGTGSQSVVALYSGDDCRSGSQSNIITLTGLASSTITLTSSQPSLVMGQTAILTAKVSSGATGFVSFTAAGVSLGTIAVDGTGTAVLSTQFTGLSPNSYSVTASYSGDSNFAPASTSVTETLSLANSVTVLTSSSDPSSYGSLVTFTATTNLGATGVVTFLDGTTTIGTATPKAGVATLSTNSLSVGKHSVEAIYAGDGNYSGSTSPVVTQLVNRAAVTLTLTSSANPSLYGNTLTFTATAPSGVTGTVTFADGVVMLGKANLDVSGRAVVSIATLPAGTHNIIATYSGDSNYF